jgi:hypothetical protein
LNTPEFASERTLPRLKVRITATITVSALGATGKERRAATLTSRARPISQKVRCERFQTSVR